MASLFSTLKVIPWADVIDAAPLLVKGARRLIATVGRQPAGTPAGTSAAADPTARLEAAETAVTALQAELADASRLIASLAEQNQTLVAALDLLQARQRALARGLLACSVAVAGCAVGVIWLAIG